MNNIHFKTYRFFGNWIAEDYHLNPTTILFTVLLTQIFAAFHDLQTGTITKQRETIAIRQNQLASQPIYASVNSRIIIVLGQSPHNCQSSTDSLNHSAWDFFCMPNSL